MTTDNFSFYLQNRQIQTSQTGGQWYSDNIPPLVFPGQSKRSISFQTQNREIFAGKYRSVPLYSHRLCLRMDQERKVDLLRGQ